MSHVSRIIPLFITLATILALSLGLACHPLQATRESRLAQKDSHRDGRTINCSAPKQPARENVEGKLDQSNKSPWRSTESRMSGRETLGAVEFVNQEAGWIGGDKLGFYKTADAGKTWQKVALNVASDSSIVSISFVNPTVGWIVASKVESIFESGGRDATKSWILNTTDGGSTWQTQYYDKALRIGQVSFVSEQEGWAVGDRIVEYQYVGFIIHTTDGGKHWTDVSANASQNESGNSGSVVKIYVQSPSKAMILKFSGVFYSTLDGGQSWKPAASLPEEPPQAFLGDFRVVGDNRMWTVGGADSIEGMWGTIARMDKDCSWTKYSIGGIWFGDAAVLSENEFIVAGAIPASGRGSNFVTRNRDGVLLHSSDGGRNWTVLYRNSNTPRINSLVSIDSNNILAAGENGYVIRLERVTPSSK